MMKTLFSKFGIPLATAILGGVVGAFCVKGALANQTDWKIGKKAEVQIQDPIAAMLKQQAEIEKQMEVMFHANPIVMNTAPSSTTLSMREDDKFVYYDINVKDPKSSGVQTKVENGFLTVSASEVAEHRAKNGVAEVQSVFEQTLPLPPNVDAKAVETIADKQKIVLKFPKLVEDHKGLEKASASVPDIDHTHGLTI